MLYCYRIVCSFVRKSVFWFITKVYKGFLNSLYLGHSLSKENIIVQSSPPPEFMYFLWNTHTGIEIRDIGDVSFLERMVGQMVGIIEIKAN